MHDAEGLAPNGRCPSGNRPSTLRGIETPHAPRIDPLRSGPFVEIGRRPFGGLRHVGQQHGHWQRQVVVEIGRRPFGGLRHEAIAGVGLPQRSMSLCGWFAISRAISSTCGTTPLDDLAARRGPEVRRCSSLCARSVPLPAGESRRDACAPSARNSLEVLDFAVGAVRLPGGEARGYALPTPPLSPYVRGLPASHRPSGDPEAG